MPPVCTDPCQAEMAKVRVARELAAPREAPMPPSPVAAMCVGCLARLSTASRGGCLRVRRLSMRLRCYWKRRSASAVARRREKKLRNQPRWTDDVGGPLTPLRAMAARADAQAVRAEVMVILIWTVEGHRAKAATAAAQR